MDSGRPGGGSPQRSSKELRTLMTSTQQSTSREAGSPDLSEDAGLGRVDLR